MTVTREQTVARLRNDAKALREMYADQRYAKLEFDMMEFGVHCGDHAPGEMNFCGTEACALGSIALSGKSGITGWWKDGQLHPMIEGVKIEPRFFGGDRTNWDVCQSYYGITDEEWNRLVYNAGVMVGGIDEERFETGHATPDNKAAYMEMLARRYETGAVDVEG